MIKHITKYIAIPLILALIFSGFSLMQDTRAQAICGPTYEVQSGDYLARIARECNLTLAALIAANPQIEDPSLIYPGQTINIPGSAVIPDTGAAALQVIPSAVQPGATLTVIGSGFPTNTRIAVGLGQANVELATRQYLFASSQGRFQVQLTLPADARPTENWLVQAIVGTGVDEIQLRQAIEVGSPIGQDTYVVQSGDTLSEIASRFGTSVPALLRANPQITDEARIYPGQVLLLPGSLNVIPDTGARVYIVESGDTLSEIAVSFGLTLDELMDANPQIENPSLIQPGQRIAIPGTNP